MIRTWLVVAVGAMASCSGTVDTAGVPQGLVTSSSWEVSRFSCEPGRTQAEVPLRRLTRQQYLNAVADVVAASGVTAADRTAILGVLGPTLAAYPEDRLVGVPGEKHGGFTRLDQAIQQSQVDVSYQVAVALGRELTSSPARLRAMLGTCASDTSTANDAQCLRDFVARLGLRVQRRPLEPAELDFHVQVAGSTPVAADAVSDVIALLLTGPRFLYHVEEADPAAGGPVELDGYALASRLAFHFWQTIPDQQLLDAAASGALGTEAGYRAEVERLFRSPRTDATIDEFFRHWLRLDELPPLDTRVGTPVFDAFAGGVVPGPSLHEDMKQEVLDTARAVTRGGGSVASLVTDRHVYARSPQLASLYGEAPWDGGAPSEFTEPARVGLLTRAAFLASGSASTRPVMKGYFIRNGLLCEAIGTPPDNAMAMPIELRPDMTTRQTVEAITEVPGSSCAGCHSSLNPLGYATENFDALGRHRTVQQLFDEQGRPTVTGPVDTRGIPLVAGVRTPVGGVAELTELLATGGEVHTCFVRQAFRFTFQRMEDPASDGCLLRSLQDAALAGQPVEDVLMAAALAPEFRRRNLR